MNQYFSLNEFSIDIIFSYSEIVEIQLGLYSQFWKQYQESINDEQKLEIIQFSIDKLEQIDNQQNNLSLNFLIKILFDSQDSKKFSINQKIIEYYQKEQLIDILIIKINQMIDFFQSNNLNEDHNNQSKISNTSLEQEINLKILLNLQYLVLLYSDGFSHYNIIIEKQMIQLLKLSIKFPKIPIKKTCLILNLNLQRLFSSQILIEEKQEINYQNQIENFYKRNINTNLDNTLAQIIVVGLLRALLTICDQNSGNNKNLDFHREWESSYLNYIAGESLILDDALFKHLYERSNMFIENITSNIQPNQTIFQEQTRHRFIIANTISTFFLQLLKNLLKNCEQQYIYVIQLITEANGLLVFLKFLTEKFSNILILNISSVLDSQQQSYFGRIVTDTVYKILKLMYKCIEYQPEKIKQNLIEYNSHVVIKKLPNLFKDNKKILKYSQRILKLHFPYFNKKTISASNNIQLISDLYGNTSQLFKQNSNLNVSLNTNDNQNDTIQPIEIQYLNNENYDQQNHKKIESSLKQKQLIQEYNTKNYWSVEKTKNPKNQKNLQQKIYQQLWDQVEISQNNDYKYEI